MRDLRAYHHGVRHVLELEVVSIPTRASNQGWIFEAPNRLTNAEFHRFIPYRRVTL